MRLELQANPLLGSVGVLALVIVATTAMAVNRRLSLWGSYERSQGAVTLLTYHLLFLLAADQLRAFSRARQLVIAMVAVSVPLVLLSLLQSIGWNPLGLVSDARSPIYATLGRTNFVGAYLVILGLLTWWLEIFRPTCSLGQRANRLTHLLIPCDCDGSFIQIAQSP